MKRPVLTVCTALGVLVLLGLGTWQVARLQWKLDLIERTEARVTAPPVPWATMTDLPPEDAEYRAVSVSGGFPTDRVAHVFGTHEGRPGWFVFQPVLPDGGTAFLLLNRGFVPQDERRETYPLPEQGGITGLVRLYEGTGGVAGLVRAPNDAGAGSYYDRRYETLAAAFADIAATRGATVFADFYLDSTMPTETPRGGTTRLDFSNRHLGYAITWYGLAGGLVTVYVAMIRRR